MAAPLDPHHAAYVGSFDPLTLGHLDLIQRASRLFVKVTVGVGVNPDKKALFTPEERVELIRSSVRSLENVDVQPFSGLTVEFIRQVGAAVMVRGVRTLSDIETEFTLTLANRALDPEIETIFLMAGDKYSHLSSSLIKQVAQLGQSGLRERLAAFVPATVIEPLLAKYKKS